MSLFKIPVSVLVIVHTSKLDILLLERVSHAGYWQSVTGSQERGESLLATAKRELFEETGLTENQGRLLNWHKSNVFEIFEEWRYRYEPGICHNTEHVFSFELDQKLPITLSQEEHRDFCWLPWQAAAEQCFSWSNRQAILVLANGEYDSKPPLS